MSRAKDKLIDFSSASYTTSTTFVAAPLESQPSTHTNNNQAIIPPNSYQSKYELVSDESSPNDSYKLVFLVSVILGVGTLLAYNVLVTSSDYFLTEYPNHQQIMFWMVPAYSGPNFIFVFVVIAYGHYFSFTTRLLVIFLSTAMVIFAVPIISQSGLSESVRYIGILIICGFVGCSTAASQATTLSFTGLLPLEYTRANVGGNSLAGLLACIIRIFTKLVEPDTHEGYIQGGWIYFIVGGLVDVICAISFLFALKTIFVKHHLKGYFEQRKMIEARRKSKRKRRRRRKNHTNKQQEQNTTDSNGDDTDACNVIIREDTMNILARVAEKEAYDDVLAIEHRGDYGYINDQQKTKNKKQKQIFAQPKQLTQTANGNDDDQNEVLIAQLCSRDTNSSGDVLLLHSSSMSRSFAGAQDMNKSMYSDHSNMRSSLPRDSLIMRECVGNMSCDEHGRNNNNGSIYHLTTKTHAKSLSQDRDVDFGNIFYKIRYAWIGCFLTYLVTFLIFPGLVVGVDSQIKWIENDDWMPVILITEFNIGDYFGRQFLTSWTKFGFKSNTLWIGALWRFLIYPIWIMLYTGGIESDIVAHISMILLSVTNGHMACLAFMYPPELVKDYEMDTSGSLMSFAAVSGIVVGSYTALGLSYVL